MSLKENSNDRLQESSITAGGENIRMVEGIAIESGIEVPRQVRRRTGWAAVAAKMKKGDSVKLLVPPKVTPEAIARPLEWQLKKIKKKFSHRTLDEGKAVRVWRV